MTQDNQPKPGENPTDPPRDPQTAPVADDVVDEVEEEAAAAKPPPENSPDAPEATYREALDGFDPHLRDAKALTLEGGVRIMRDLFPFQKPLFRADGNIPANIGRYRIAKNDDDTAALLFAFDPDDLKEPDLSIDSPPGRLDRIHVVQARKEESPAHWAYPAIVNHQHMLQNGRSPTSPCIRPAPMSGGLIRWVMCSTHLKSPMRPKREKTAIRRKSNTLSGCFPTPRTAVSSPM